MTKPKRSAVHRGVEILFHPADKKRSGQWSVSGGFLKPRVFFASQGRAKRYIDSRKDGKREGGKSATAAAATATAKARPTSALRGPAAGAPFNGKRLRGADGLDRVFNATKGPDTNALMPTAGTRTRVPTVLRREQLAAGPLPADFGTVPNKPALKHDREVLYPELVLVRFLEASGWRAAWSKNWGGKAYWRAIHQEVPIPAFVLEVCSWLSTQVTGSGGAWDVVAWKEPDRILFVESKQRGKDALRPNQREWLEAAVNAGMSLNSFAIVEYVVSK